MARTRTPQVVRDVETAIGTDEFPEKFLAAREFVQECEGKLQDAANLDIEARADKAAPTLKAAR